MPMLLKSDDGNEFELSLIKDAIPDPQDGFGDTASAVVSFRVATADEEWEETAPCLNLFELDNLAEWLTSVGGESHDEAEVDLLGPELNFQVIKQEADRVTIRIRFRLDDRPEELKVDAETTEMRALDVRVDRELVRVAAQTLKNDLRLFRDEPKDDLDGAGDDGIASGLPELGLEGVDDPDKLSTAVATSEPVDEDEGKR